MIFEIDVTRKPPGKRLQMNEVGVYTVASGKMAKEEFLYTACPISLSRFRPTRPVWGWVGFALQTTYLTVLTASKERRRYDTHR